MMKNYKFTYYAMMSYKILTIVIKAQNEPEAWQKFRLKKPTHAVISVEHFI